jgi:hypothetical protein
MILTSLASEKTNGMSEELRELDIRQRDLEPSITPEHGGENQHQEDKSGIR